jgi:outer membrane usher protein
MCVSVSRYRFSGGNATLDARAFSEFGLVTQSGIVGTTPIGPNREFLRLESTYAYSDQEWGVTGRAGDLNSGGLAWTRPIHMGGVQVQRDFALNPNVVTAPMPVISGTAAAPSTVDVFVNGLKTYSQNVADGPFSMSNVPMLSGDGEAHVVVRDAAGRQTETKLQLSNTTRLLKPGIFDFSVESGYARRNFGLLSNSYDRDPIGSASLRGGIHSNVTLDAHVEAGAGLKNALVGVDISLSWLGVFSSALAYSSFRPISPSQMVLINDNYVRQGAGYQIFGAWQRSFGDISVNASSQRSFSRYNDLVSATADLSGLMNSNLTPANLLTAISSLAPPKALDQIGIGTPLKFDAGSIELSYIHVLYQNRQYDNIAALTYMRPLPQRANFSFTGFADFGSTRKIGALATLTVPLSDSVYASVGGNHTSGNGSNGVVQITKSQPLDDNSYGYQLYDNEGATGTRSATGTYRTAFGQVGGQIQQSSGATQGIATYDGSIALMGAGIAAGNHVNTSFALVNAGKSDVPILQDNKRIGTTNIFGTKLVADLRPNDGLPPEK